MAQLSSSLSIDTSSRGTRGGKLTLIDPDSTTGHFARFEREKGRRRIHVKLKTVNVRPSHQLPCTFGCQKCSLTMTRAYDPCRISLSRGIDGSASRRIESIRTARAQRFCSHRCSGSVSRYMLAMPATILPAHLVARSSSAPRSQRWRQPVLSVPDLAWLEITVHRDHCRSDVPLVPELDLIRAVKSEIARPVRHR